MRVLLAGCFAVAVGGIASAEQHFDIRGAGTTSCAKYAETYRKNPDYTDNVYYSWAQGYMSGLNSMNVEFFFDLNAKTTDEEKRFLRL
jgi:hypothetical protein